MRPLNHLIGLILIPMAKKSVKKAKKSVSKKKSAPSKKSTVSKPKQPVQPLADRVLVRREDAPEKKSASGILLPENMQKEKSKIGTVLAVGPGRMNDAGECIAMTVSIGDRVVFNAGWDNEVAMGDDDTDHFLVRESDILAILNK